jgi:hypothetical protein
MWLMQLPNHTKNKPRGKQMISKIKKPSKKSTIDKTNVFVVGKNYFIQTVTLYFTGKLMAITDKFIVLSSAAWIADTGRFTQAIDSGNFDEIEIYKNPIIIPIGAIVVATEINFGLPEVQK